MKKHIKLIKCPFSIILIVFLFALLNEQLIEAQQRCPMIGYTQGPIVILKADDYCGANSAEIANWQRFYNIIEGNKICACIGVMASCISNGDLIKSLHNQYYINDLNESVHRYEYWNHGLTHESNEFYGTNFDFQFDHINNAQVLIQNLCGFELNAFCPPFGKYDQNTKDAIKKFNNENNDQIKIWMGYSDGAFDQIDHTGWSYIPKLEYGTYGYYNYNHLYYYTTYADGAGNSLPSGYNDEHDTLDFYPGHFMRWYDAGVFNAYPFIVIQIHPGNWQRNVDASFTELVNMITFLKGKNALFVTPSYIYNKANNEHYCGDFTGNSTINATSSLSTGISSQTQCGEYTIVHNGANVSFTASKNIYLSPGFKSVTGSVFKASIIPEVTTTSMKSQVVSKLENTRFSEVEPKINIYPNPNNGIFTISLGYQRINNSYIIIYDLCGKEIRRINAASSKEIIDLSNYPRGTYSVRVLSDKNVSTYKVVKE